MTDKEKLQKIKEIIARDSWSTHIEDKLEDEVEKLRDIEKVLND